MRMARIGILVDEKASQKSWKYGINVFNKYLGEILSHVGITYKWVGHVNELNRSQLDIIYIGHIEENVETATKIQEFAEDGGTVIAFSSLHMLMKQFGYAKAGVYHAGYANLSESFEHTRPLRFLHALPLFKQEEVGEVSVEELGEIFDQSPTGTRIGVAIQQFQIGNGKVCRWAVDVVASIVGFQQGTKPILEDGVPAKEYSGKVNDGVLKKDDGVEMDWEVDRKSTHTGQSYFAHPYADLWREVIISQLMRLALEKDLTIPFIGYWPEGIRGVATFSHDSDGNVDEHAEATLALLEELQINTTWCMMDRGYSKGIHEKVLDAGHELALHFNARPEDNGIWSEQAFEEQVKVCKEITGLDEITSNKNHYTRFEGWGELYSWCEKYGIQSDQTHGPSKKGNVGFLFGTCQPFYPIAWSNEHNRIYDVVELSYVAPDIPHWSDDSVVVPLLDEIEKREGLAHFLFHQLRIHRAEEVRDAFRNVVNEIRQRGFDVWTGKQVNEWVRAKRKLRIEGLDSSGKVICSNLKVKQPIVVWVPTTNQIDEKSVGLEKRFGVYCEKIVYTQSSAQIQVSDL